MKVALLEKQQKEIEEGMRLKEEVLKKIESEKMQKLEQEQRNAELEAARKQDEQEMSKL